MPRVVDHEKQRELIAYAACRVLAQKGVSGARMVDFANEVGFSTGMLLNYYDNKDAIVTAALRVPFLNVIATTKKLLKSGNSDLYTLLEPCIPVTQKTFDDCSVWVSFWGAMIADEKLVKLNTALHEESIQLVEDAIRAAWPEAHDWSDVLMNDVRLSVSTYLFGLSTGGVANPTDWTSDAQKRQLKIQLEMLRNWARQQDQT